MKDLIKFYNSELTNTFTKSVRPLRECYGLDVIVYTSIKPDGTFFQVCNQPDLSIYYWNSLLYRSNPFIRHPRGYKAGTFILNDYRSPDFHDSQEQVKQYYESNNVMATFFKQNDTLFWVAYSSTNPRLPIRNIFLNERYVLENFSFHLHKLWKQNMPKMDNFSVNIAAELGPLFLQASNPSIQEQYAEESKGKLLSSMGLLDPRLHSLPKFSKRQKECLILLLRGKTTPQIATILHLSPRTIETYIEQLKNRLSCYSKSEIFELAYQLQQAGLL